MSTVRTATPPARPSRTAAVIAAAVIGLGVLGGAVGATLGGIGVATAVHDVGHVHHFVHGASRDGSGRHP